MMMITKEMIAEKHPIPYKAVKRLEHNAYQRGYRKGMTSKLTVSKAFVGKITARIYCDRKSSGAIKAHVRKAFEEIGVEVQP